MNILMLCEYFHPFTHGGSEWSVYHLVKQLQRKQVKVSILTPNYGTKTREIWQQIPIYRFPFVKFRNYQDVVSPFWLTNPLFWFVSSIALIQTLGTFPAEIIHVQSKSMLPAAIFAKLVFGKKVLVTLRDYYLICPFGLCLTKGRNYKACSLGFLLKVEVLQYLRSYVDQVTWFTYIFHYLSCINSRFTCRFFRFLLSFSDKVIAISLKQKAILESNHIQIDDVIYNTAKFIKSEGQKSRKILLFIGRLTPGKGAMLFVEAVESLDIKDKTISCVVIGKGLLKNQLLHLASTSVVPIRFLGYVPYKRLSSYFQQTLLTVIPSVWEEPFGRVALESLAHGVPVIVSNRGGLPEILGGHKIGYVSQPNAQDLSKSITKGIINNDHLRTTINNSWGILVDKFSTQPLQQYIKHYEQLVSKN